jgi:Uncharacterised nucleotidyltransferase
VSHWYTRNKAMTASSPANTAASASNPKANLEGFLCGDLEAVPSLEVLRARRLEAWAYMVLPTGHPLKAICKSAFITARARHELIKQEVLEMVRAWNAAGIEPVLYKGFALAEFTYPQPGTRFHGDVDVLVRPEDFRQALEVGHERGWETPQPMEDWLFNQSANPHELSLKKYQAHAAFDVHQRLVPAIHPWTPREHAMTQKAWGNSRPVEWEGTRIRLLSPEDAFLFGMVISRCWSGDGWRLKSHDLLDGLALIRQGLTRESVLARAKTLNISRTVNAFLARCDPFAAKLEIRPPSSIKVFQLELNSANEHVPLMFSRSTMRLLRAAGAILTAPAWLPLWFEVRHTLQQANLNQALETLEGSHRMGFSVRNTSLIWWLARRSKQTTSLTWPVMVYIALRRQGLQVNFKLGERNGLQRAWVEVNAKALPEFVLEHGPLEEFKVVLTRA